MHTCRCYFLDDHELINAESTETNALTDAIDRAIVPLCARPHHRAVEVWQGARRIYLSTIEYGSDSPARSAGQERAN
jgi:hypothetical protein